MRIVATNVEKVVTLRQIEPAKVVSVVCQEDRSNFASWDVEEVGDVFGGGGGVTEDVLGLGKDLRDVVAVVGCEGRERFGKAQRNEIVDGDDVAAVGIEGGFWDRGK